MESSVVPQTLDNTVGALLLGIIVASVLYGITCLQGYLYYHRFDRDPLQQKLSVAILWLLDTVHYSLAIHLVYHYMVKGFAHNSLLLYLVWSIKVQVYINVVIILMVQSLYAYRVWLLGGLHRGYLEYVVSLALACGFGIGILLAVKLASLSRFQELHTISWAVESSLAVATTIDIATSLAMCYYLAKSKSPMSQFNSKISVLMQFTLGSGLLISATSTAALVCFILMPDTFVFVALEVLLTKLYVNSYIAMLNARTPNKTPNVSYNDSYGNRLTSLPRSNTGNTGLSSIQCQISVVTHRDEEIGVALGGEDDKRSDLSPRADQPAPMYAVGW